MEAKKKINKKKITNSFDNLTEQEKIKLKNKPVQDTIKNKKTKNTSVKINNKDNEFVKDIYDDEFDDFDLLKDSDDSIEKMSENSDNEIFSNKNIFDSMQGESKNKEQIINDVIDKFIHNTKKHGYIEYHKIVDLSKVLHLSHEYVDNIVKILEKENITIDFTKDELQDENFLMHMEKDIQEDSMYGASRESLIASAHIHGDFSEEEKVETQEEFKYFQLNDSVKTYLRDIGNIPLLNKKTEQQIANRIALSKKVSLECLSAFPYVHKEILIIKKRIMNGSMSLKNVIQFTDFNEDNVPKLKEEQDAFNAHLEEIKKMMNQEYQIYLSYRKSLHESNKKKEMLAAVKKNKEKIQSEIQAIKFSNKFIKQLGSKIEKLIHKIEDKKKSIFNTMNILNNLLLLQKTYYMLKNVLN